MSVINEEEGLSRQVSRLAWGIYMHIQVGTDAGHLRGELDRLLEQVQDDTREKEAR